jgi:hypothetical protein
MTIHVDNAKTEFGATPNPNANIAEELTRAWKLKEAASRDLVEHKDGGWPDHIVYSHSQGYGGYFAATWKKHEDWLRKLLNAGPASSYVDAKGNYDEKLDPVSRYKAKDIIENILPWKVQKLGGLTVINRTDSPGLTGEELMEALENQDLSHLPEMPAEQGFACRVVKIDDVRPHGENLSIVTVAGNEVVANLDNGNFRWAAGELAVYVPEGAIIPDDVLKERGYWDEERGRGMLEGKQKNRVKMRRFAGHESRGLLFKLEPIDVDGLDPTLTHKVVRGPMMHLAVKEGLDVAEFLGITEHKV